MNAHLKDVRVKAAGLGAGLPDDLIAIDVVGTACQFVLEDYSVSIPPGTGDPYRNYPPR
jgi:hypothetical protein